MKRLMIVADNSFAAQSIRLALRQTSGFQVIGFIDGIGADRARVAPSSRPTSSSSTTRRSRSTRIARLEELTVMLPEAKRIFLTIRMDDDVARTRRSRPAPRP